MIKHRALFLDKDGVINVDHGYVCTPERTNFIDGIFELCRAATAHGYLNVVVTNQAGIARGYYTEKEFLVYMDWVRGEFRKRHAQLDAVYYCPHHSVHGVGQYQRDCECRKPKPGMLFAAQRDMKLDLAGSLLVGDSQSDLDAGRTVGLRECIQVQAKQLSSGAAMLDPIELQHVLRALARMG